MELMKRCQRAFSSSDRQKGRQYFLRGAVTITEESSVGIDAEVQGSGSARYRVKLVWRDAKRDSLLEIYCSCPRFAGTSDCKHVVAAILAVDAHGICRKIPGNGPLQVMEWEGDDDHEWGATVDDDDGDDDDLPEMDGFDEADLTGSVYRGRGPARPMRSANRKSSARPRANKPPAIKSTWKAPLQRLAAEQALGDESDSDQRPVGPREIWYLLERSVRSSTGWLQVGLWQRPLKKDGTWGTFKRFKLARAEIDRLPVAEDRVVIGLLAGNQPAWSYDNSQGYHYGGAFADLSDFALAPAMCEILLPRLCATGRFAVSNNMYGPEAGSLQLLSWDDGPAWKAKLCVEKMPDGKLWTLSGRLQREGDVVALKDPLALSSAGYVVFSDRMARFEHMHDLGLLETLRVDGPLQVPLQDVPQFVETMALLPQALAIDWPDELRWEEVRATPLPQLTLSKSKNKWATDLNCRLEFLYGERRAVFGSGPRAWYDKKARRLTRRDLEAEHAAGEQLLRDGAKRSAEYYPEEPFSVAPAKMPRLASAAAAAGWLVQAEGKLIRRPGSFSIELTTGVDWFDLEGACDFGGARASLPRLLEALHRGEQFVVLDDGSQGLLPEDWLRRYAPLANLGKAQGDRLRFVPTQAAFLDALLAAQEGSQVTIDREFGQIREKLQSFAGIKPCHEPKSFHGVLRDYQRLGLGWLRFLDEFGFGGCLADDMGLGKTVQILAWLDERRAARGPANGQKSSRKSAGTDGGPSLVVVPRSLVHNWIEEARRFTPELRVLNYTGLERSGLQEQLHDHDLIVTTYGTLRRDIAVLTRVEFDYAILDEAQAIKNPASQSAKASRLLVARRRLAMTGTPVENHLGELWSLFEFLNPGMLGRHQKLSELIGSGRRGRQSLSAADPTQQPRVDLSLLSRALRPFMLRRTKEQVLSELPEKTEQTLYCELEGEQRALYNELRDHYRLSLNRRIATHGVNKSKFQVLEALLRLRQAACHPGLLDKKRLDAGSAKLEALLEQLAEVIAQGHKALIFSQFTSLLAIVRRTLDSRGLTYEYLDGRTVKRQAKVHRFQTDPECRLFLISLKAGGVGLNLTAADYVFILDPWWNPAVEAQAVDRAHRIGQNRHVFAYRLIARDTVEEKILQLQDQKRDLAEALVAADENVLKKLTLDDLQLLLS